MAFRLPTHLESFVPPPSEQVPQQRPWQGTVILVQPSDKGPSQEIRVTAVETDGDNRVDLWPARFFVQLTHGTTPLKDVQTWVRRHRPPICTFMPDRLRDPVDNTSNQARFRSLSRTLFESQMVAIAPWNTPERLPGAGIIIYPAQNSSAILVAVIFLSSSFPDFLTLSPSGSFVPSPTLISPTQSRNPGYPQTMAQPSSSYAMPRHNIAQSSHRHGLYPNPAGQPISDTKPDDYRYAMSRTVPSYNNPSTSTDPSWTVVKDEDDGDLSAFTTALRSGHGSSQYPQ